MNRILRILRVAFNLREGGVIQYKIAYYRDLYDGYNSTNGDELDAAVKQYFDDKNPTQCGWEYIGGFSKDILIQYLSGFCSKNIPLVISASLDGLTYLEKDELVQKGTDFPDAKKKVTLFYRCTAVEDDVEKEVRVALDYRIYLQRSGTIHPYLPEE